MKVWRICRSKYKSSAFSGTGAEKTGGRWSYKGYPLVYTSENLSLAALELFVHVSPGIIPTDLIAICGALPASISVEEVQVSDLPSDWRQYPAPAKLKKIGTDWIVRQSSLALRVPSAINAQETNILINPAHTEMKKLKIEEEQLFHFDPRMFGK
ncbi:MAG: RES family NAD+ phosphorylase [Pirellulales bacterium]